MKNRGLHVPCPCSNTPQILIFPGSGNSDQMCPRRAYFLTWGGKPDPGAICDHVVPVRFNTMQYKYNTCSDHPPNSHRPQSYRLIEDLRSAACQHYHITIMGQLCQHYHTLIRVSTITQPTLLNSDSVTQSDHAKDSHKMTERREPNEENR